VFFAKSAQTLENKRIELLEVAKMCRRVPKSLKGKSLRGVGSDEWREIEGRPRGCTLKAPPPMFL
jgi:hypothetical protein